MRYMGDAAGMTEFISLTNNPMDPSLKAAAMAQAKTLGDPKAQDILDISDETPLGHRTKLIRLAEGAAAGILLGVLIGALQKHR